MKEPKNKNYCATVVKVKSLIELPNMNNVVHVNILGNLVITGKDTKVNELYLYFPVECQLSDLYCKTNNLYRDATLNSDNTKKGYIDDKNRRIRCEKFYKQTYESNGLLMPLSSVSYTNINISELKEGVEFDELNGFEICRKYVVTTNTKIQAEKGNKRNNKSKKVSKLVEKQFNFHIDTSQFEKNLHNIYPTDVLHISTKAHGTSAISSNILCKRQLKWYERLLVRFGIEVSDTYYDNVYSSRSVIKNDTDNGFYGEGNDVWKYANDIVYSLLPKGMTAYYEIVGYVPTGGYVQKQYDYSMIAPIDKNYTFGKHFDIHVYRLTYTNTDGKVYEFGAKQVQDWCKANGIKAVNELFYGNANSIVTISNEYTESELNDWRERLRDKLKELYLEKDSILCNNKVPEEGVVIRKEGLGLNVWKYKSYRFKLHETKQLDNGEIDIESVESINK